MHIDAATTVSASQKVRKMSNTLSPWLTRKEAAKYLGISLSSLAHMACDGFGPRFFKAGGKVRYKKEDLDCWAMGEEFEPLPMTMQNFCRDRSRHTANTSVDDHAICEQIIEEFIGESRKDFGL